MLVLDDFTDADSTGTSLTEGEHTNTRTGRARDTTTHTDRGHCNHANNRAH